MTSLRRLYHKLWREYHSFASWRWRRVLEGESVKHQIQARGMIAHHDASYCHHCDRIKGL